jgi:hypothetical protein
VLLADCIRATVWLVDNAGGEELLEVVEQLPGGGFVEPTAELGGCRRGMNEGLDKLNALSMTEGGEQSSDWTRLELGELGPRSVHLPGDDPNSGATRAGVQHSVVLHRTLFGSSQLGHERAHDRQVLVGDWFGACSARLEGGDTHSEVGDSVG